MSKNVEEFMYYNKENNEWYLFKGTFTNFIIFIRNHKNYEALEPFNEYV